MKNSAFKVGEFMAFLLNRKFIKVEHVIYFLVSKKLIHEGEIISSIHMDGLNTIIVERVSSDKKAFLEGPISSEDFSYRFVKAVRQGNPNIKNRQDLISEPIQELRKLKGFKDDCEKELQAFRKKNEV